ncbi:MAG: mannosyltransferase [Kordia sp.]|nr:MAG: mannosyltransferase [Kordia sp.]
MLNSAFLKAYKKPFLAIIASFLGYYFFSYELIRADFNSLLICYTGLFLLFLFLTKKELNWKSLITITILFRVIFLIATPNLSQDFYRFIWDGRMLLNGFNPYLYLPEIYQAPDYTSPNQAAELVAGMGNLNASHYSNYPPLNQLCFAIAALFAHKSILGSIVAMRVLIILADIGVLYFGTKLLKALHLNPKAIFLYLLNPLIIIELTGNLHFEGIMIFFLIWSLYLLQQYKWKIAAIVLACSISLKLLPLLFLPLFFQQFKLKKLIPFYAIVGITCVLLFTPFISENLISNYSKTIGLWFGTFEFNGSIYLLIREIGYQVKGYNIIGIVGKTTPLIVVLFMLFISFFRKNKSTQQLIIALLFGLSFYLFTSSTIHPWYVAMLLALSIFTKYRFPLVWSFTIVLSYSFYKNEAFINNYWLIAIEYIFVFGFMIWEVIYFKKKKQLELNQTVL